MSLKIGHISCACSYLTWTTFKFIKYTYQNYYSGDEIIYHKLGIIGVNTLKINAKAHNHTVVLTYCMR